jgi:hypothetical protein
MANQMSWNNSTNRYEFELPNGDLLTVDGDEFGEAHADRAKTLSGVTSANDATPEDAEQAFEDTLEATQWEALVGVNDGVAIIPASAR